MYLPEPATRRVIFDRPKWRWHVRVCHRDLCGVPVARPSARAVRADGRCRSTRRKPCSSKRASCKLSPAFAEARRRRQVVEHRIARLVQLGIRQARYFGRTKTLFQLCLAAAVANLTLLAAATDTLSMTDSAAFGQCMTILMTMLSLSSLLLGFRLATPVIHHSTHFDRLIHHMVPIVRSLTPPCRLGF